MFVHTQGLLEKIKKEKKIIDKIKVWFKEIYNSLVKELSKSHTILVVKNPDIITGIDSIFIKGMFDLKNTQKIGILEVSNGQFIRHDNLNSLKQKYKNMVWFPAFWWRF
jgi:hypothetical protein